MEALFTKTNASDAIFQSSKVMPTIVSQNILLATNSVR